MLGKIWRRFGQLINPDAGPAISRWDTGSKNLAEPKFPILLYRILGNDLEPRHDIGQTRRSLEFILENEAAFPNSQKCFIVNRIVDGEREAEILRVLDRYRVPHKILPFDPERYAQLGWEADPFGGIEFFDSEAFLNSNRNLQYLAAIWLCSPKIRYTMNINSSRNFAIDEGLSAGNWVLPTDGNCFFTDACWNALCGVTESSPSAHYMVVPMIRLADNEAYFAGSAISTATEEPQLGFAKASSERYDETYPYGIRDKVELLMRLGVSGVWDKWSIPAWLPAQRPPLREAGVAHVKEPVLRLSSGIAQLDTPAGQQQRYLSRNQAILRMIAHLNRKFGTIDPQYNRIIEAIGARH